MDDMKRTLAELIAGAMEAAYPGTEGLPTEDEIAGYLEVPPEKDMGDYAFPCFKLSRALHKAPPQIAQALAQAVNAPQVCEAKTLGGYLNFYFKRDNFAAQTVEKVLAAEGRYGSSDIGAGKTGIHVVTRLMGLIIAAISIEMIASGLGSLFPGLLA